MGMIVAPSRLFPPQFHFAACLVLAIIGAVITATTFCLSDRFELRLGALAGGSLMCSPYVGFYDMVILAPAALQLIWPRDQRAWPLSIAAAGLLLYPFPTPWELLVAAMAAPALAIVDRYRPTAMLGSPSMRLAADGLA
jgi:hypothetical protein